MKRFIPICMAFVAAIFVAVPAKAQDVQLFYDTGRNCATSTVEMFHPDSGGSTYFFVDMDYSPRVMGAYWEISREFNFWQSSKVNWLSVHLEYNGGLNTSALSFNNAFLGGLTYSGHSSDYSKTWSLTASYKLIPGTKNLAGECDAHNFQITGVWNVNFAKGWLDFNGFVDFWREARTWQNTSYIFITEPQLWFNFNKIPGWDKVHLSVGGEVELSYNFVKSGFAVMPAVGLKWNFK
ncbi:MAG: DUF5020 family protein [Alistipes sp.]|nr:DUF5020 family protein [Alistipes sp.]MBR5206370.1 DUF5020 family protein [Alistipes sp.]